MEKQIVYIDMDNVLVDFPSAIPLIPKETLEKYDNHADLVPGIFSLMKPVKDALEAFHYLAKYFDVYILSTAPWNNPSSWSDKLRWVQKNLGEVAYKRLILTHHKELNRGDYLIDDRTKNGAGEFQGTLIQYGSEQFPDWNAILDYFTDMLLRHILLPLSDKDYVFLREEELKTDGVIWKHALSEIRTAYEDKMIECYKAHYSLKEVDEIEVLWGNKWSPPTSVEYKDYPNYFRVEKKVYPFIQPLTHEEMGNLKLPLSDIDYLRLEGEEILFSNSIWQHKLPKLEEAFDHLLFKYFDLKYPNCPVGADEVLFCIPPWITLDNVEQIEDIVARWVALRYLKKEHRFSQMLSKALEQHPALIEKLKEIEEKQEEK